MKYYFPTTTLNFDSILSSQLISPAGMYRPDTLWWNRFEQVVGQRKDSIVLYNKIPTWTINDPDRDNYPLVVEIDKSFSNGQKQEYTLGKAIKAVVVTTSISFTALELEQGKVRFLFRNVEEMERMLIKASTSVAECKVVNSIRLDFPNAFSILPKGKTISLEAAADKLAKALAETPEAETPVYPGGLVREERERGAELGYKVGRYAKSLRSGSFVDAFRVPLSYAEWKAKILPEPFAAILDYFCSLPIQPWDPNRIAIVAFCRERWGDCFKGKKVAGKEVLEGTSLHASLQAIARHWASPEEVYRISGEKDPYMQAFAAFLECGTQAGRYPRFAREALLKSPEYLLSLYGALVGYTSFSRVLLDNKMYLPSPPQPKVVESSGEHAHQRDGGANRSDCIEACQKGGDTQKVKKQPVDVPQPESGGLLGNMFGGIVSRFLPQTKKADGEMSLFDYADNKQTEELVKDKQLLVCDENLCADVAKEFAIMGEQRLRKLTCAIQDFCSAYTSGYYGQNPQKYSQTNPDLIDHMMRCFKSVKTRAMNFEWLNKDEENKFVMYLENRYECRRKSHNEQ